MDSTPAVGRVMRDSAKKILDDKSIHPLIPVLSDFPFVGATSYLDIYALFSVEPMHVFHLGVSRLLKEVAAERLRSTELTTTNYRTVYRTTRTFSSIRNAILRHVNRFIDEASRHTDGTNIGLYIRNTEGRPGLNGVFTEEGLAGMLEAADMKKVDIISPFIGGILDRVCGECDAAPVTTVFTQYVDIMNSVCGCNGRNHWSDDDVSRLRNDIAQLKATAVGVFAAYQKSQMGTVKWHMLDHVPDDIVRNGGLFISDAGLYEYSHILFKQSYRKTSMRRRSEMDDAVATLGRQLAEPDSTTTRKRPKHKEMEDEEQESLCVTRRRACKEDTACASRSHMKISAALLEQTTGICEEIVRKPYAAYDGPLPISSHVWKYLRAIGSDAHRTLVQLVREHLQTKYNLTRMVDFVNVSLSRPAYVSAIRTPRGDTVTAENAVEIVDTDERLLQRVYATDNFYGSGKPRFETVMLQAGTTVRAGIKYNTVFFGKALGILTLKAKDRMRPNSDRCILHNYKDCVNFSMSMSEGLVFVQCYDVIGESGVRKDNVDKTLDCIRLKWERHGEECEGRELGKVFALCPLDSV